jgi:hypothetical protein
MKRMKGPKIILLHVIYSEGNFLLIFALHHSKGDYFPYMVADAITVIVLTKFSL